jgi:hypothetical protein
VHRGRRAARRVAIAATGSFALAAALPAQGQEAGERDFAGLPTAAAYLEHVRMRLQLVNRFVAPSDFGRFDASYNRPEGRFVIELPVNQNAVARILGTGHVLAWDFDGSSDLFGVGETSDAPFDDLDAWTLRVQGGYLLPERSAVFAAHERWGILAEGWGRSSWEAGSDMEEGLRGGGALAFGYLIPDRLELAVGVSVGTKLLGSGVSASPVVELKWRIDDQWTLRNSGLGAEIEYDVNDRFALFARGRYEGGGYRLGPRGDGIGRGAVQLRQVPAGIGFRWKPLRHVRLTTFAGVMAYHQIEVRSGSDHRLGKVTGDPAPMVSLRIDLRR